MAEREAHAGSSTYLYHEEEEEENAARCSAAGDMALWRIAHHASICCCHLFAAPYRAM